ncbi:hypothetical protein MBLNU457_1965t1 [Dothideomycetes sp. NU457]
MPSSADEAFNQEDNRTSNAGLDKKRKKTKKNSKKTAYSIVHEEERERARPDTGDLLAPPTLADDNYLSSSPDIPSFAIQPPEEFYSHNNHPQDPIDILEQDIPAPSKNFVETQPEEAHPEEISHETLTEPQPRHETLLDLSEPVVAKREQNAISSNSTSNGAHGKLPDTDDSPSKTEHNFSRQQTRPISSKPISNIRSSPRSSPTNYMGSPIPSAFDVPSPHLPQRHYSRQPDMAYGLNQESQILPGTKDYHCGFHTLDGSGAEQAETAHNVLFVGSEGGLDVSRFNRHRRDVIGRLEGLRGSVLDAQVLPCAFKQDPFAALRPLVVCIIHGPIIEDSNGPLNDVHAYQTSVEIYSLSRSKHVATLYQGQEQTLQYPVTHRSFVAPAPSEDLTLSARGCFVAVASGISGEVFIFAHDNQAPDDANLGFRCVGKFWTRTRAKYTASEQGKNAGTPVQEMPEDGPTRQIPIFSLSDRWLAVTPPLLSASQKSLDGNVATSTTNPNPPGVSDYVSPPPPSADCEVDVPTGSGLLNRVTKQATQEIRKGAQWVGEQGIGMLKSYWARPASSAPPAQPPVRKLSPDDTTSAFPPTHAHGRGDSIAKIDPSLVSIVDLQKLLGFEEAKFKSPLLPIATFNLQDGCSFLSFAPNGLALLTANQVGDTTNIWDLMRVTDAATASAVPLSSGSSLQYATGLIRKITTFSRMSPSSIIDVRWAPQGNRIGILTDKATVHLHELPRFDFLSIVPKSPAASPAILGREFPSPSSSPQQLAEGGWMGNVKSGWQNVSDRFSSIRAPSEGGGLVNSTRQSLGQAGVTARYVGTRVMRNGYNQAWEGAYNLRHASDNKIRLKTSQCPVKPGSFAWLSGEEEGLLSTVSDGVLSVHTIRSHFHTQGKRLIVTLEATKRSGHDQALPGISSMSLPPAVLGSLDPQGRYGSCARSGVHGFWTLDRQGGMRSVDDTTLQEPPSVNTQDKDTCPQYLPLHRHRGVDLFTHDDQNQTKLGQALGAMEPDQPWVFGLQLPSTTKITAPSTRSTHGFNHDDLSGGVVDIVGQMDDFDMEEDTRTITSSRRSGKFGSSDFDGLEDRLEHDRRSNRI